MRQTRAAGTGDGTVEPVFIRGLMIQLMAYFAAQLQDTNSKTSFA